MNHLPPTPDNPSISIFCLQKFAKIFRDKGTPLVLLKPSGKFTAGVNSTGGHIFPDIYNGCGNNGSI
jgi:hypothetical protein